MEPKATQQLLMPARTLKCNISLIFFAMFFEKFLTLSIFIFLSLDRPILIFQNIYFQIFHLPF